MKKASLEQDEPWPSKQMRPGHQKRGANANRWMNCTTEAHTPKVAIATDSTQQKKKRQFLYNQKHISKAFCYHSYQVRVAPCGS
jgi:hypothetical protein